MKILYITTKATYGGVQTHILQCAKYMLSNNNIVAVMAYPNNDEGLEGEIKKLNIDFFPNKFLKNSFNPIYGIRAVFRIRKVVKEFKPNLISCHSSSAGFWGRLAVLNKVPVVFTAHGWGFTNGVSFFRFFIALITEKITSFLCKKIICVSENDRNLAIKYKIASENKLIAIYNGVETDEIKFNLDLKLKYKLNKKIPIIFVGRLSNGKNPEQLIKVFTQLPKKLQEISQIYIIGDGKKRKMLENLIVVNNISNSVYLLGELKREEVLAFLSECINFSKNNCGIFTLISDHEGFPRSILEAMRFGYAVIASDVGGIKEVVSEDVGFLIDKNNNNILKNKLQFLLENPNKIKEMGEKGERKIFKDFSLESMLQKTVKVYESIIK